MGCKGLRHIGLLWSISAGLIVLALIFAHLLPSSQLAYSTEYPGTSNVQIIDVPRHFNFPLDSGEQPLWSPNGRQLAYISTVGNDQRILVTDVYEGMVRDVSKSGSADVRLAWSPDGRQLVYDSFQNDNWDIYTADVCDDRTCNPTPRRLTYGISLDARPSWSPDGQQIAFLSTRTDRLEIFVMDADGSHERRLTQNSNASIEPPKWSPDGSQLMFVSLRIGNPDIFVMDSTCGDLPDGCEGHIRNLTQHPGLDNQAAWSPDGRWVAFTSRRDGNFEIYVVSADGGEPRNLTHYPAEDRSPVWSPDSRTIAFQSNRDKLYSDEIYVLDVVTGDQWRVTTSFGFSQSPVWSPG